MLIGHYILLGVGIRGASHFNSFRLLQVTSDSVIDRAFEFNPRAVGAKWKSIAVRSRPLSHNRYAEPTVAAKVAALSTADIRVSCRREAARILELKSRLLKPSGPLPVMVDRPVSLRVSAERDTFDKTGRLIRPKDAEQTMPLFEAVRQARRTILLGDLGTGKSTLAGQLVIDTLDRSKTAVAVLIPAKTLRLSGRFTRRDLLVSVANYVKDTVWLALLPSPWRIYSISKWKCCLSLMDSMSLQGMSRDGCCRAAAIVENWPTVQVVATARPVELVGASIRIGV